MLKGIASTGFYETEVTFLGDKAPGTAAVPGEDFLRC